MAHDIALVMVNVFEKKTVIELNVIKKTKALLGRFKRSHSATKILCEKTLKTHKKELNVLLPGATRWSSNFIMLKRVLKINKEVNEVRNIFLLNQNIF